jgi:hypothetical protein
MKINTPVEQQINPQIIKEANSFLKSGLYKSGFYNLYTKDQVNEILNTNYRLAEKMPRKGHELIISLPKVDGVYSLIVVRRALVNSTENKSLYLYEYLERID